MLKKLVIVMAVVMMAGSVIGQTTWPKVYKKQHFTDSTYAAKGIKFPDGTVATTGFSSNDTISIDSLLYIPHIYYDNGDTSNFAIPFKIGDIYIDVQNSKIYISWSPVRGGWIKLN